MRLGAGVEMQYTLFRLEAMDWTVLRSRPWFAINEKFDSGFEPLLKYRMLRTQRCPSERRAIFSVISNHSRIISKHE